MNLHKYINRNNNNHKLIEIKIMLIEKVEGKKQL